MVRERFHKLGRRALPQLIWIMLSFLSTTQLYSIYKLENRNVPIWRIICWQSPTWLVWILLMPCALWVIHRYRLERNNWKRVVWVHLFASILFSLINLALVASLHYLIPLFPDMKTSVRSAILSCLFYIHINVMTYWSILGISGAFDFYHRWQNEELRAAQLKEQLAQAQLQALQLQLHPHFLFNTLHTIATLVDEKPLLARQMIARLGDFLRLTLGNHTVEVVTLGREMEYARAYLSIEELRFQDRLQVDYSIAPETMAAKVPYLILQPLVENAIRHGLSSRASDGKLMLNAKRIENKLHIEVRDNGGKINSSNIGVGLENTRTRLAQMYGSTAQLNLTIDTQGITVAAIELPFTATS